MLKQLLDLMCEKKAPVLRAVFVKPAKKQPGGAVVPGLVARVLLKYPDIDAMAPTPEELEVLSSWTQVKNYVIPKYITAVRLHVRTHFLRRLKKIIRSKAADEAAATRALKYLFGGVEPGDAALQAAVDAIIARLKGCGAWDAKLNSPCLGKDGSTGADEDCKLSRELLEWHLEICRDAAISCQPFPLANMVQRMYHRVDNVIFRNMMRDIVKADARLTLQSALGLTPEAWNNSRIPRRLRCTRLHDGRLKKDLKKPRNVCKLKSNQVISSVETDGYGVSVVIDTPHKQPAAEKRTAVDAALENIQRLRGLYAEGEVELTADDPGRKNLATCATVTTGGTAAVAAAPRAEQKPIHFQYTRDRWKKATGDAKWKAWEAGRRAAPEVKSALEALSESGGKRHADRGKWAAYLRACNEHWGTLCTEFLENDERAALRMLRFRRGQRALASLASSIVGAGDRRKPLIVAMGSGSFGSHGRGSTDTSVPTKAIYRAIMRAFKQVGRAGGTFKVWEHRTTMTCHRCGEVMQKEYVAQADGSRREVHDYRVCNTCVHEKSYTRVHGAPVDCDPTCCERCGETELEIRSEGAIFRRCAGNCAQEKRPKLRNRDFNAAINILLAAEAELRGELRPAHLCPVPQERRPKRRAPRKKKPEGGDSGDWSNPTP